MQFQVIDLKLDNQMGKISFVNCLLRIQLCNAWNFPSLEFHMGTLQRSADGIISIDQSVMKQ